VDTLYNYFCQLLDMQRIKNVRLTEIHTAESLVPEPKFFFSLRFLLTV
jgi:hypothetical protein